MNLIGIDQSLLCNLQQMPEKSYGKLVTIIFII